MLIILISIVIFWIFTLVSGESLTGNAKGDGFVNAIGFLFALVAAFYPILVGGNIADQIEPIAQHNKKMEKENRKKEIIKIPHPKRGIIFALTLLGFFTLGI
jgi:hypothetical protein